MSLSLDAVVEHFPIAGTFTISRGSKTTASVVTCRISDGAHTGSGECVPYGRYGETIDSVLAEIGRVPTSSLQTSSLGLTRAILSETDRITLLTHHESRAEQDMGLLTVLPVAVPHPGRHVQVTTRTDWLPTAVQVRFLEALHAQAHAGTTKARKARRA